MLLYVKIFLDYESYFLYGKLQSTAACNTSQFLLRPLKSLEALLWIKSWAFHKRQPFCFDSILTNINTVLCICGILKIVTFFFDDQQTELLIVKIMMMFIHEHQVQVLVSINYYKKIIARLSSEVYGMK